AMQRAVVPVHAATEIQARCDRDAILLAREDDDSDALTGGNEYPVPVADVDDRTHARAILARAAVNGVRRGRDPENDVPFGYFGSKQSLERDPARILPLLHGRGRLCLGEAGSASADCRNQARG